MYRIEGGGGWGVDWMDGALAVSLNLVSLG